MRAIHALGHALGLAGSMTWEILWALILGFALSAIVQAVVRRGPQLQRGDSDPGHRLPLQVDHAPLDRNVVLDELQ